MSRIQMHYRIRSIGVAVFALLLCFGLPTQAAPPESPTEEHFEQRVASLLEQHCHECHNPDAFEGGLDLTTPAGLLQGSDSGAVVRAGDREKSLLYEVVHDGAMPPEGEGLAEEEIEAIGDWIASGARFRDPPALSSKDPGPHDVIPILLLRCTACHGAELQRGGLDLRTLAGVSRGGESGPAIVAGDPEASLMMQRIEQQLCPPQGQLLKYFVRRPSSVEVETLQKWIAAGAPDHDAVGAGPAEERGTEVGEEARRHWAFQPLPEKVDIPDFAEVDLPQPIDAFIQQRLEQQGLQFSPRALRSTLIRRVYLDLTGIPPTYDELQHWHSDPDEDWYQEMVDQLLQSPRYGERWGRFWLDVAGYADSEGGVAEDVVREVAWKYRDYVIRSFNDDKPWDRFLMQQIAGDELADYTDPAHVTDEITDNLIATGFLRMGVDQTGSRTMNFVPERLGLIADALNVVGSGVMGMTMECARCHSHKYDPIPHQDYYRFKAIFQGAFDEHDWMSWKTRTLEVASPAAVARYKATNPPLEKEIKALEKERSRAVARLQDPYYESRWPKLSSAVQEEILAALKEIAGRRTLRQEELVQLYETELRPRESVLVEMHPELGTELEEIDRRLAELRQRLLPPLTIRALWDRGRPSPTYLLVRGEHDRPGPPVQPGVPSALPDDFTALEISPPWPGAEKTGRRLAFARWLTRPDHPLTARVIVNRIWSHHFGRGIVKTLDNFGHQGARPTHPELLDWLARDFIDGGWSLKSLHRTILLSRTFQQSSLRTPDRDSIDPENVWLSRMSMRRLDAEALRDSILAASGRLDDQMFGPPAPVTVREDGLIMEQGSARGFRRSVYLRLRRTELPSLLSTFDYPEMQPNCSERMVSTVSPQSLMLANNAHIYAWSGDFADRVLRQAGGDAERCVDAAYRMALSRSPTAEERVEGIGALAMLQHEWQRSAVDPKSARRQALATFCHTLLNSAEFLYVD